MDNVSFLALDTETTGLEPDEDRIVEIGVVEFRNGLVTGREWHTYLNPEREVAQEAIDVHGLTQDFLADKPLFKDVAAAFLEFCESHVIVIHNASFDLGFLDAELGRLQLPKFTGRFEVRDSLQEARRKFRGPVNLDALCRKFNVDITDRKLHGGLKDASLLAQMYMRMTGTEGLAHAFAAPAAEAKLAAKGPQLAVRVLRESLGVIAPTEPEMVAHQAFMAKIKNSVWASISA